MNSETIPLYSAVLLPLPSGALFWPKQDLLVVSDLHLGKAARLSAIGGAALPPYEAQETLGRLAQDLDSTQARRVICLGDSFDAPGLDRELPEDARLHIAALQAGRDWIWIEGNHDPGPVSLGGHHLAEVTIGPLTFRHIARPEAKGEVSGHYHPKARLCLRGRTITRPAFLFDSCRLILPAYGAYTGGLRSDSPALDTLMGPDAQAVLTGATTARLPMRHRTTSRRA